MLVNIGHGSMVMASRILAVISPESAPVRRIIQDSRDKGRLIDATYGRKTKSVIITDSDHVILSARLPASIHSNMDGKQPKDSIEDTAE